MASRMDTLLNFCVICVLVYGNIALLFTNYGYFLESLDRINFYFGAGEPCAEAEIPNHAKLRTQTQAQHAKPRQEARYESPPKELVRQEKNHIDTDPAEKSFWEKTQRADDEITGPAGRQRDRRTDPPYGSLDQEFNMEAQIKKVRRHTDINPKRAPRQQGEEENNNRQVSQADDEVGSTAGQKGVHRIDLPYSSPDQDDLNPQYDDPVGTGAAAAQRKKSCADYVVTRDQFAPRVPTHWLDGRVDAWWFLREAEPRPLEAPGDPRGRLRPRPPPPAGGRPPFPTAWPGEGCAAHLAETERARAQKALLERPPGGWPRVGLCLIIRNAEEYLAEWAAHHRAFGVDRVIVFDDESEDDPRGILETHIAEGFVKVWDRSRPRITRTSGTIELQQNFYRECLRAFLEEGEVSWVGLTDVDEFLTAKEWAPGDTLPSLLHQQAPLPSAAAGGLGVGAAAKRGLGGGPLCVEVGRATYGASFRLQRPPGLATEAYLLRTGKPYTSLTNKLPKILVNLEYADREKLGRFVGAILIHNSMAHGMEKCAGWGKSPLRLNHYLGTAASWALKVATHRTGTGKFLGGFQSFFPKDYEDEADGNALPYLCAAKREMARARGGRRPPGPPAGEGVRRRRRRGDRGAQMRW